MASDTAPGVQQLANTKTPRPEFTLLPLDLSDVDHLMAWASVEPIGHRCRRVLIPLAFFFGRRHKGREQENPPLPPSPPSWIPVLGHLHLVKPPVHRALAELSRRHAAPVLLLRLGTRRALVVSSPAAIEECFTANDVAFASRPRSLAGRHLSYDNTTVTTAPYGRLWRDLRRVATVEVLSACRLHGFSPVRSEEVRSLVRRLFVGAGGGGGSSSPPAWVTRMTAGRRFQEIVEESLRLRGLTNRWEFLPWLRWVDLGVVERRMRRLRRTRDAFLQRLVDEHRSRRRGRREKDDGDGERRTAVEVMLSLQESDPGFYTDDIIKRFQWGRSPSSPSATGAEPRWGTVRKAAAEVFGVRRRGREEGSRC